MEVTVENMFTERLYEVQEVVPAASLSRVDRKRVLSHVMADITHRILASPAPDPTGLTITVQPAPNASTTESPDLLVTATCPQYELSEGFFSS